MKILLTGANGFIGKNLLQHLEKKGHEVISFTGDIVNLKDCFVNFEQDIDAVIHLAAYGNNSKHFQNNKNYLNNQTIDVNLIGTLNLVKLFLLSKAKVFITAGSSSEYGVINKPLSIETTPSIKGQNIYSVTKETISELFKGLNLISDKRFHVLRLFTVYGKGEAENHFIPTILRSLHENTTMPLSSGSHDYVYIRDVCRAFEKLLTKGPVVSHAATGKQYTNLQVIKLIEKITKKKVHYYKVSKLYTYDRKVWVSDKKSILTKPKYTLEQGLREWLNSKN